MDIPEYKHWKQKQEVHIRSIELFENHEIIHQPEIITANTKIYNISNSLILSNWIRRRTDTSIALDQNNNFYSSGTCTGIINNALLNSRTHDIAFQRNNGLFLFDSSHHDWKSYAWILYRNGVNDIKQYLNYLAANATTHKSRKHYSFVINTRWSAHNFYHWFHECIPRLLLFQKLYGDLHKVELIWGGNIKPKSYQLDSMREIGINIQNLVFIDGIISIDTLITVSFVHKGSFHPLQSKLASKVFKSFSGSHKTSKKYVMIMRKKGKARSIINQEDIEKFAKKNGIYLVYLEDISLDEQVQLFENAHIVIAAHGAGLTHIINMKKNSSVIEIMPSDSIHPLYWYLSTIQEVKYSCIVSKIAGKYQGLYVNMLELQDLLEIHKCT